MTKNEITFAANYIAKLALESNGAEKVNLALESLLSTYEKEAKIDTPKNEFQPVTTIITFTQKELSKMDKDFRNIIILNGLAARVRTRRSGRDGYIYEIRFRAHGYDVVACSVSLEIAKAKFLDKTRPSEIQKWKIPPSKLQRKGKNQMRKVFDEWITLKQGTIGEKEIKRFISNFNNLPEEIRYAEIYDIRAIDLDAILKDVQPRKYEELRTLFNGIFKYALACGLIERNPVALIQFKRAERKNRECLSKEEIKTFLRRIKDAKYDEIRQGAYILYYFGLRPCEIDEETHLEGDFLVTRNRKRKNGKIEYKKIPVPKDAWTNIDWNNPLTFQCGKERFHNLFKDLLEGKTAYCLRHTFATTCQQYVRPDIVDIWMGDSSTRLVGRVYTHFPDDFMLENMMKVVFPK